MLHFEVIIVGAGIVGLATAWQLLRQFPAKRVLIVEKEAEIAMHQTGRNSGVLHSGIYYRPGSLRAVNCRAGKEAMEQFCAEYGVACEICGKVIAAVEKRELPLLESIYQRGLANGVRCELIDRNRLSELEPHAAGIRAIYVPEAGIVNYRSVAEKLAELIVRAGGTICCNAQVEHIRTHTRPSVVETAAGEFSFDFLVTCAGLHSDRVTELTGQRAPARIVPFRGEYYELRPHARHLCRNLIYPVPDPNFPFLGVHFTRMIGGAVECGPNAVLAFAREGYRKLDFSPRDMWESVSYPGFLRLAGRHWRAGLDEICRSVSKGAFVRALKRLVPDIQTAHLAPAAPGIRAQAVAPNGRLVDDFLICGDGRVVNVCNAPSPAATASLHIGRQIVDRLVAAWS